MEFTVNTKGLKACSDDLDALYKQLRHSRLTLEVCMRGLNTDMLSSSYWSIRLNLNRISKSINNQMLHTRQLSNDIDKIVNIYVKTENSILEIEKTQAEIDEKERQTREVIAGIAKFAVFALCTVATVAVIVGTGGAATPFALGAVGLVTGSVTAATDDMLDEYVEKGNLKELDINKLSQDMAVSGLVGFATGFVGGTVGESLKGTKLIKSGLESTHFISRVGANCFVGSAKNVVNGGLERCITSTANGMYQGRIDRIDILKSIWNPKEIAGDALGGVVGGTVDEIVGSASKINHFDSKYLNSDNSVKRTISNGVVEGTKGSISGIGERYGESRIVDGKSAADSLKEAMDVKEIAKDFIKDGAEEGAKSFTGKPVGEQISTAKKLEDNPDLLKSMPKSGSGVVKWVKDGGKI